MPALVTLLYLVPIMGLLIARAHASRSLSEFAIDIPIAVAADLLLVLLLARLLPLERAAVLARAIEVLAAIGWVARRRARGETLVLPRSLSVAASMAAIAGAACGSALSLMLSRKYQIWDRYWHISLVPTIRVQRIPFANVYEPHGRLWYHYSGDVLASVLQAFSRGSIHSSYALSLAHDVMFGLTGATLALLLLAWGARSIWTVVLGVAAWFLSGPAALLRDDGQQWAGYNFLNFITLSFRPHECLAGLFVVGFIGAVLGRVEAAEETPLAATTASLTILTVALSITDETICGMLGVGLGGSWLVWPNIFGSSRRRGFVVLLGMFAAIIVASYLYFGLLTAGAGRPSIKVVPWRSPGFANATIPFSRGGAKMFIEDTFGFAAVAAAAAWRSWTHRRGSDLAMATLLAIVILFGCFGLGRFEIAPHPIEAHRFVTAPMLVAPLIALFWLVTAAPMRRPLSATPKWLLLVGLVLPAASTLAWMRSPGKTEFQTQASFNTDEDFFQTDCRQEVGARLGDEPAPIYAAPDLLFLYSGCRPTFLAGKPGAHKIKARGPLYGVDALANLNDEILEPDAPLTVVCPSAGTRDAVCQRALSGGSCRRVGAARDGREIVRCEVSPADRRSLLADLQGRGARTPATRSAAPQPAREPSDAEKASGAAP